MTARLRRSSAPYVALALVLSGALAYLLLIPGLQHSPGGAASFALFGALTAVFFAALRVLLWPSLAAAVRSLPAGLQTGLPVACCVLGYLAARLSLQDPGGSALPGSARVAEAVTLGAMGIVIGAVLFGVALALIGRDRPVQPLVLIVPVLFGAYLMVGLQVVDDYGVSTDEHTQRYHGLVAVKYLLGTLLGLDPPGRLAPVEDLPDYAYRYYGVAQHLPIVFLELLNRLENPQTIWLLRHHLTFLFFFTSAIFMFLLGRAAVGHWGYGLCATVLYVLHPRIFAESFYNIKDTTFLAAFAIALYFAYRFLNERQLWPALLFGATLAFAANIRILGIGLGLLVGFVLLLELLAEGRRFLPGNWKPLAAFTAAFLVVFVLCAPVFWAAPADFPLRVMQFLVEGSSAWEARIIYQGAWLGGDELPWHYMPVWITISSPLPVLLLFGVGAGVAVARGVSARFNLLNLRCDAPLFFLALAVAPVLATALLGGQMHSGWRHLFFVYAPIVIVACFGLRGIVGAIRRDRHVAVRAGGAGLLVILAVLQLETLRWSVAQHPHQQVYFNTLVRVFGGREGFQRDYWRMAVRQAMDEILARDDRPRIAVAVRHERYSSTLRKHLEIFDGAVRDRMRPVSGIGAPVADYVIEVYRDPVRPMPEGYLKVHEIVVDGLPILTLYADRALAPLWDAEAPAAAQSM